LPKPKRLVLFGALALLAALPAPAAQCGDPKSTAGYFLEVVRAIALDYDLSDPRPIGTLLEGKLTPDAAHARPDYENLGSSSLFGQPASVIYSRHDTPAPHERGVVTLVVKLGGSWPDIAPDTVAACFADIGEKPRNIPHRDGPGVSWEKTVPRAVEGGGAVRVFWTAGQDEKRLEYLAIFLDR